MFLNSTHQKWILVEIVLVVSFILLPHQRVEGRHKCNLGILISIERKGCFGDCPAYSAKVYADGTVVYVGKHNVKELGERRYRISQESIQALIKEFRRIDYFALKDRYEVDENGRSVTDQPTTTTSICLDGKKKEIVNYYFAPKELEQLEDKIDSLAGLNQFIGPL